MLGASKSIESNQKIAKFAFMTDQSMSKINPKSSRGDARSFKRNLLFGAITFVLFFTVIEMIVRLVGFDAWQLDFSVYRNVPGDITPNQKIDYRFLNFDHRYTITINEQGWREPSRLSGRPFRVLCVGDSSTLGFGVEDHETYPVQLQKYLDGHFEGLFDVINAGVVGYTIDDELEYLLEKGFALEPSVVVLEVFWNDVLEKSIRKKSSQREFSKKSWPYMRPASWAMDSALYQSVRNKFLRMEVERGDFPELPTDQLQVAMEPERHTDVWAPYDEQFLRLAEECRNRGIALIVAVTPHQYQVYDWNFPAWNYAGSDGFQLHVAEICARASSQYVDLLPVYREEAKSYSPLYLSEGLYDEHVGPIGQWIKAREVFEAIKAGPLKGGYHNLYHETVEGELLLTHVVRPGRLWRPKDDNGGLFFMRGGVVAIQIPKEALGSGGYVFSAGLATIGNKSAGVSLLFYDAELIDNSDPANPDIRILGEFAPLSFPTSDEIRESRAEFPGLAGNVILIAVDEPLSIEGLNGMQSHLRNLRQNKIESEDTGEQNFKEDHEYYYFMRQPLIYPKSMTNPNAAKAAETP